MLRIAALSFNVFFTSPQVLHSRTREAEGTVTFRTLIGRLLQVDGVNVVHAIPFTVTNRTNKFFKAYGTPNFVG